MGRQLESEVTLPSLFFLGIMEDCQWSEKKMLRWYNLLDAYMYCAKSHQALLH